MGYEYVPKVGDLVYALGQNGTFQVAEAHTSPNTVDLQLVGAEFSLKGIPWGVLTLAKKRTREDVNQAASRIIREATERD